MMDSLKYLFPVTWLVIISIYADAQPRTGKDYALFFYCTDFQPGWAALPETAREAKSLATELESSYGFTTKSIANPTKKQILDEIAASNTRIGPDDQLLLFFSMHGYYDAPSDLGYLIAADGQYNDPYFESWLDYNSLRPYLARSKARHILIALDACYSGSFGNRTKAPDHPAYNESMDCVGKITAAFKYTSRQYICSGNKETKTPAKSLFAAQFLEILRKGPEGNNGVFDFDLLAYQLTRINNPKPEGGNFTGHDPGGGFLFIRKNACMPIKPVESPEPASKDPDQAAINIARRQNNEEAYHFYLDSWPNGRFRQDAQNALKTIREDRIWQTVIHENTESSYQHYLDSMPNGRFVSKAKSAIYDIQEERVWLVATIKNNESAYKNYQSIYCPGGKHCAESNERLTNQDNFILVHGGTFTMGCTSDHKDDDLAVLGIINHEVTLSDFYLSKYEVTVAAFKSFIEATGFKTDADKNGNSLVWDGSSWVYQDGVNWRCDASGNIRPSSEFDHPVVHVSWNDAYEYCKWLSKKNGPVYRLPTEAEWEFAARGGLASKGKVYAGSNDIENVGWSKKNTLHAGTSAVGKKFPNEIGLYDMSGNVWEWCWDWFSDYPSKAKTNPTGPASLLMGKILVYHMHVCRGGSWDSNEKYCRVWNRVLGMPDYDSKCNGSVGFRVVRAVKN